MGATMCAGEAPDCSEALEKVDVAYTASKAMLIFDWDDTLMCSSAIESIDGSSPALQELERAAEALLQQAMRHGEVCIVTNASMMWVWQSAKKFLPRLVPILNRITVVSARDEHSPNHPGNPTEWKRCAFEQLYTSWQRQHAESETQLVVLGDSMTEINAAHRISGPSCLKTLKFKEDPSVTDLLGELHSAAQELDGIIQARDSKTMSLVRESNKMPTCSKGWRLTSKEMPSVPGQTSAFAGA
jgi:hypothetical protein